MTENEAIKKLNMLDEALNFQRYDSDECSCALQMAIQALEKQSMVNEILHELREYSAIGTVEEFKALKEKSVAKIGLSRGQGHESYLVCPACNSHMKDDQELWDLDGEIIQCKKCKQLVLVDWSE